MATIPTGALPDKFDPWEHLQGQYIAEFNRQVKRYFSDHGADWRPNVADKRSSMHTACMALDTDSYSILALRMSFFFDLLGQSKKDLLVYQGSFEAVTPPVGGHPKVVMYFSQDKSSVTVGQEFVDMECSFRLMNETPATFTKDNAVAIANKVKSQMLVSGKGIEFVKGKNIYNYKHEEKGYRLLVRGNTEADSVDLIKRLLECQDIVYDVDRLSISEPKKSNTAVPENHTVYGKVVKMPKFRPTATVRFRYAYVEVPGLKKNIFLVDTTGRHSALLV